MITETQLLAYRFCAEQRTRYAINRLKITEKGRVIATDGKHAIFVEPAEDLGDKAGNEQGKEIFIPPDTVRRALDMMRSERMYTRKGKKKQPVKAVKITEDEENLVFDQDGIKLIVKHEKSYTDGVFPDADGAIALIDPKQDDDCRSVFIDIFILKEVINALCNMVAEDRKGIELSLSSKDCDGKRGFRIDATGKCGEKISYFLMQISK